MAVRDSNSWAIIRPMSDLRKYQNLPNLNPELPGAGLAFDCLWIAAEEVGDLGNGQWAVVGGR